MVSALCTSLVALSALSLPLTSAYPSSNSYGYNRHQLSRRAYHPSGVPYSANTVEFSAAVPRPAALQKNFEEKIKALSDGLVPGGFGGRIVTGTNGSSLPLGLVNGTGNGTTTVPLTGLGGAVSYAVNITIGAQEFVVIADTGSSDLWLHTSNFTCVDSNYTVIPQDECYFGPTGINLTADSFQPLNYSNNFNISYGDGTFVFGNAGTDNVTIGNITVMNAEFSVAELAYWNGDGVSDGLLGLASPLLTSVYFGNDGSNDTGANADLYYPWFYQAVLQNLTAPYFSLVINRPTLTEEINYNNSVPSLGSLTFGGIPTNISLTNTTVTVPNINFTAHIDGMNYTSPAYYTTSADSVNFPGSDAINTTIPAIILDSGTTLVYLPDNITAAINDLWTPPALYDSDYGIYFVDCNATAPELNITIGGVDFSFDSRDLVYSADDGYPNDCISSIVPGGSVSSGGVSILGDRFLVNVVSTFNIASGEITITQREKY